MMNGAAEPPIGLPGVGSVVTEDPFAAAWGIVVGAVVELGAAVGVVEGTGARVVVGEIGVVVGEGGRVVDGTVVGSGGKVVDGTVVGVVSGVGESTTVTAPAAVRPVPSVASIE